LEAVVRDFFKYDEDGEILIVNKGFWKLTGEKKILRYLAAAAGRKFLGIDVPDLGFDNAQISKGLNMKHNSVRGHLSQLRTKGLVKTEKGKSYVTIQGLHELLEKEGEGNA